MRTFAPIRPYLTRKTALTKVIDMPNDEDLFDSEARSNFHHEYEFVVQAWDSSLERWLDTIYGNDTLPACLKFSVPRAVDPTRWIGGKVGQIRIVRRCA